MTHTYQRSAIAQLILEQLHNNIRPEPEAIVNSLFDTWIEMQDYLDLVVYARSQIATLTLTYNKS